MADKQRPGLTERAEAELAARREREAAALRANLRRRKAQGGTVPSPHPEDTMQTDLPRREPMG